MTTPTQSLLQGHPYTPSHSTDVTQTWRRFGWKPKANPVPHGLPIDLIEPERDPLGNWRKIQPAQPKPDMHELMQWAMRYIDREILPPSASD